MDITPIYDLRARLRAAMIAGTNLLSEDFRLKRAVEAVVPLEQASPVFARIGQLSRSLLDPAQTDKEGALLDTITLVDAVLCTQGAVAAEQKEIEKLPGNAWGKTVTNAPYSVVSALSEALTSSGSGHYTYVTEVHEERPELFLDYRVKVAMVQALGAGYAELAEQVEDWLEEENASLLPLLQSHFDPTGKKEMVRRVRVMEAIAPKEANSFFREQVAEAKKEVLLALIFALRHCPENEDLLWDLTKSERGNGKQAAYRALLHMESERVEQYFTELCGQKPLEAMALLRFTSNSWAARLVAKELTRQIRDFEEKNDFQTNEQALLLQTTLYAAVGKTGPEIISALRETIRLESKLDNKQNNPFENKQKNSRNWTFSQSYSGGTLILKYHSFPDMLGEILQWMLKRTADRELAEFVLEVFEEKQRTKQEWRVYFPAAATAHLLMDEDSAGWLSAQLLGPARPKELYRPLAWAWSGISWSESRQAFILEVKEDGFDLLDRYYETYVLTLKQDMSGAIADVFMQCDNEMDGILAKCVSKENEAYRTKLEEHYYRRALTVNDNRACMESLKKLGCKRCEGLAVHYFEKHSGKVSGWEIRTLGNHYLPGDNAAKYQELMQVYEMIKSGKIQLQKSPSNGLEDILEYVESLKG